MNRRSFGHSLAAFTATLALDPERLLWRPGSKTIFIPPSPELAFHPDSFRVAFNPDDVFRMGDIITFGTSPKRYVITAIGGVGSFSFRAA